jgi:hypothetical protein
MTSPETLNTKVSVNKLLFLVRMIRSSCIFHQVTQSKKLNNKFKSHNLAAVRNRVKAQPVDDSDLRQSTELRMWAILKWS